MNVFGAVILDEKLILSDFNDTQRISAHFDWAAGKEYILCQKFVSGWKAGLSHRGQGGIPPTGFVVFRAVGWPAGRPFLTPGIPGWQTAG